VSNVETNAPADTSAADSLVAKWTKRIKDAASDVVSFGAKLEESRIVLGSHCLSLSESLVMLGVEASDIQARIESLVADSRLEWTSIAQWIRAASVQRSLPAEVRESFGVDACRALASVKDADERNALAVSLAEKGTTGVRATRDAVKDQRPTKPEPKGTAAKVAEVVKQGERIGKGDGFVAADASPVEVALFAVKLRDKCPGFSPTIMRQAFEQLLFAGAVAPVADGSDAKDAQ
jgi:hypothetical protein